MKKAKPNYEKKNKTIIVNLSIKNLSQFLLLKRKMKTVCESDKRRNEAKANNRTESHQEEKKTQHFENILVKNRHLEKKTIFKP